MKISVFIITFNEENIIAKCLEKLYWANEILIVDSGSSDQTVAICEQYGAKIIYNKFENFGQQKQFALQQTTNKWVLSLDADEVLSDELINEIQKLDLEQSTKSGFLIPRTHVFLNKVFQYGNENKKPILRLFDKTVGSFTPDKVHETIKVEGKTGVLSNEMLHYTVFDISTAIQKQIKYSLLSGELFFEKEKKASLLKPFIKFPFEFIRVYFIHRNILNGYEGFVWSMFSAFGSFLKYAKLYDLYQNKER
ncbi:MULTISPECIES: glycosyltransferase family 2 protein [Flavobacterium]|uniref:Glycosyltransferase family 2 protein n=2 Tax=Flavobacterium TaxID=237 RepID=A0AA94JNT7_9FLAO|nr:MULTISPECIES: glycosyltransferase family 2 protein [Flavobacterium]OXA79785.1 glycosyl transferase [Flavobacterium columnare] [Flavobacterium columnare NBRC 100251 = ATCC 23463]AMA49323.1 glycosyl transferase [Flavobacterium covae]AND63023.1 glycosyl transferase [Flavobacterium covae]MCH4828579.1 glycosyltransferase family 2 protein [Flavobacterium columnare]MCH4831831.1 glycosyltransferase family 2 protein [Flavobacterium columnare]